MGESQMSIVPKGCCCCNNIIAIVCQVFSHYPRPYNNESKKKVPIVSETSFNITYSTHELELGFQLSIYSRLYDLIIKFCIYLLSDIMSKIILILYLFDVIFFLFYNGWNI